MTTTLSHPEAVVRIEELPQGRSRVSVHPHDPSAYIHAPSCVTSYPLDLIRCILEAKGPAYVCDEILRDEDAHYVKQHLEPTLFAHVEPRDFAGKRLLDFGCGSGASTAILARLMPETEIVGVELQEKNLRVAEARAAACGLKNVLFLRSPQGDEIPEGLGRFDCVVLSAVYEHMLPEERRRLMPKLWACLRTGGILFLDETPYRWFPVETHTTGLPLINYLPDGLALAYARRFSRRVARGESWGALLRAGIRGGSVGEILANLRIGGGRPVLLRPRRDGIEDWVDLWERGYSLGPDGPHESLKRWAKPLLKLLYRVSGWTCVSYLSLAVRKGE